MDNSGFYIIELPVITRKNGRHNKTQSSPNEITYLHGDGCSYAIHCSQCPLPTNCRYTKKPTKQELITAGIKV